MGVACPNIVAAAIAVQRTANGRGAVGRQPRAGKPSPAGQPRQPGRCSPISAGGDRRGGGAEGAADGSRHQRPRRTTRRGLTRPAAGSVPRRVAPPGTKRSPAGERPGRAVANEALPFHSGGAQSNPYLLKIDFNVPSVPSVARAAFIFSSNSRFPFRTANAALGLGDADWYVSTTRAP